MDDSIFGPPDFSANFNFPPKEEPKQNQAAGEDDVFGPTAVAAAIPAPPAAAPAATEINSKATDVEAKPKRLSAMEEITKEEDEKVFKDLQKVAKDSAQPDVFDSSPSSAPATKPKTDDFDYDTFNSFMAVARKNVERVDVPEAELERIIKDAESVRCFEKLDIDSLRVEPRQLFDWSLKVRAKLDYLHSLQVKVNVLAHTMKRQYERMKKVVMHCASGKNVNDREVQGEKHLMKMSEKFELVTSAHEVLEICYLDLTAQAQFLSRQMNWFEDRSFKEKALYEDAIPNKPSESQDEEEKQEKPEADFPSVDVGSKPSDIPSTEKLESFNPSKAESKSSSPTAATSVVSFCDF